jgi:molybdopterin synthase sulfur carrier subunit
MVRVSFTPNLQRHVECPTTEVEAATVADALDVVFRGNPRLRGYILDDQGEVRKHVALFIDGRLIADRIRLTDAVPSGGEIFVMQALSGG